MANELIKIEKQLKLGTPTKEQLTTELLEHVEVSKEILARQEEEKIKKALTNPSAIALSTTLHSAGEGVNSVKKTTRQLFILYLVNQFVARAVNARADTLISKGYSIVGEDQKGVDACTNLIDASGKDQLFWQTAVNTYIAGDGFLEKVYNTNANRILNLKHVHPLTLEYKTDEKSGKILVDKNKEPVGYVQYYVDKNGNEVEKDVNKERIVHHRFNTLGDEFTGLSYIQPGYDTIVRLMNMEYSAAEAAIKTANPLIVGICNTKSPSQIALWGQILGRINGRDQIFVPQDMEIKFLSPGQQNFNDYADYFLNAVVATFGVPAGVLLGESSNSNRAEGTVLTRHFYSSIAREQKALSTFFNNIFEEYAMLQGFKAPKLVFGDVAEDAALTSKAAIELYTAGLISLEEARVMIGLLPGVSGKLKENSSLDTELKKSDAVTAHPEEPGRAAGSQAGKKSTAKLDPNSKTSPFSK